MTDEEKTIRTPMMYINDVTKLFFARLRKFSDEQGIPNGYRRILIHLAHHDGVTQLELAKLSHVTPPTVSVTLQKMEHDGLISRVTDPDDQRQVRVRLTDKGRAIEAENKQNADKTEAMALCCLTDSEKAELKSLIMRVYENMESFDSAEADGNSKE